MLILDIFIIYLACGSPFAVSRLLRKETYFGVPNVLSSFATMLYWPYLIPSTIKRVYRRRSKEYSSNGADSDSHVSELREELEKEWCEALTSKELNSFRDLLLRYIHISLELKMEYASDGVPELLTVAGHSDPDVGYACLKRQNRKKLELHQTSSRVDFIESIETLLAADRLRAWDLAIELADEVGDESGRLELEMLETEQNKTAIAA